MLDEGDARRLRDEGHGARRARVCLEDVQLVARKRELQIEQATRAEPAGDRARRFSDLLLPYTRDARRGNDDGGVAGMAPGALDVLENRGNPGVGAVAKDVDVELDRV